MALSLHYSLLLVTIFALFVSIHPSAAHSRKLIKSAEESSFTPSLDEARRYLERFGYMEGGLENLNGVTDESSIEAAIRTYQENNHLNVTGKLDSETVDRMMTPRCGMPDIVLKPAKGGRHGSKLGRFHVVGRYRFFGRMDPWTKRHLTYNFTSIIESVSFDDLRDICARAFGRWASVTTFQFQEAAEGEPADIKIGFYYGAHGDIPFDGPGNVCAHASAPPDGRLHFDGSEQWSTTTPTMYQVDLESVTVHEIGHTLGLDHSDDENAVMYAYIRSGAVKRELQQDDIDGIQALYPSK